MDERVNSCCRPHEPVTRQSSEQFAQVMLDAITDFITAIDPDYRIIRANKGAREAFGADVVGKNCYEVYRGRSDVCPDCPAEHVKQTGAPAMCATHVTMNGSPTEVLAFPVQDETGRLTAIVTHGRDITARVQAQEELRRHQAQLAHMARLSTMGEMASGLAHELNQPLSAIVNYAQGCVRRARSGKSQPEELARAMEQVGLQAQRAAEVIRRLREFVGKGELRRIRADVNDIVRSVAALDELEARQEQVAVVLDLADDIPSIQVDVIQVEQVILNLVRNAIDAMSETDRDKRRLTITTSVNDDNEVEVAVRDCGHGIASEMADRIFEPFFTSKPGGMGMGLSISRSIIDAHGGRLWSTPNGDGGATFHLALPVVSGACHDE